MGMRHNRIVTHLFSEWYRVTIWGSDEDLYFFAPTELSRQQSRFTGWREK